MEDLTDFETTQIQKAAHNTTVLCPSFLQYYVVNYISRRVIMLDIIPMKVENDKLTSLICRQLYYNKYLLN